MKLETLGSVATYVNGRAFKPSEWEKSGVPIIRIQNLTDKKADFNYSHNTFEPKYKVYNGDLLFAWSASLGAHIWNRNDAWLNQHIFKIIPKESVDKNFLYYFLKKVTLELYSKTHGTGMVHITKQPFMATPIFVPSLKEQQKIVNRIELELSELDSGIKTLLTIKQQLAIYRQAVLKEAFKGSLTTSWRLKHETANADSVLLGIRNSNSVIGSCPMMERINLPVLSDKWKWVSVGDISTGAEYGTSKKSLKKGKVPVLRMGNVQEGVFNWEDLAYTNDNNDIEKYLLNKGDVIFNRTNSPEHVGKTAIFKGNRDAIFAGYLIRINQVKDIDPDYLNFYLNSSTARLYGNKVKTDGVNQSNINSKKLYSYPFPLCDIAEQKQVVLELTSRLSICSNIENIVDSLLSKSNSMRQSILKQAFNGETKQ